MKLEEKALEYHSKNPSGKIRTVISKPLDNQEDLSLAYSPGVAAPCRSIAEDSQESFKYTNRKNLVGVISNGTAVLGLGNIGPEASKPVMEGKAMLFKKFADIDVFDLEIAATDPDHFIQAVKALEPTFGGINLEDIKAPECFQIEESLQSQMNIPVFHDDQHGTAIIAAAALLNALEITGKKINQIQVVFSGGGAAAIACAKLLLDLGLSKDNLLMCDSKGVLHTDRDAGNKYKAMFARKTNLRTIAEALDGADVFIGVSGKGVISGEMIKKMRNQPIIFALANPDPEILPEEALASRPDAIIATGRSDYPNQVNNVLGFPYIFRGALDVQARRITTEMKLAAVKAIADLAKEEVPEAVMQVYAQKETYRFGKDYLIPKPVDPRMLMHIAPAVAQAAIDSGVARQIIDIDKYREQVETILGPTKQIIRRFRKNIVKGCSFTGKKPTIVLPHGHDIRIIKASIQLFSEGEINPILLGDPIHIEGIANSVGIKDIGKKVTIINPLNNSDHDVFAEQLFEARKRKGISKTRAHELVRNNNYFAAQMLLSGQGDGIVTGLVEPYRVSLKPYLEIIGVNHHRTLAGVQLVVINNKPYFFADCTINIDPTPMQIADICEIAAHTAKSLTNDPIKVALLSFSSFGSNPHPKGKKVAEAIEILQTRPVEFQFDGEIQADVALNPELQQEEFPFCKLQGQANVFVFPELTAANIAYKLVANLTESSSLGPILIGPNMPIHILERGATVEDTTNMIYFTADQVTSNRGRQHGKP